MTVFAEQESHLVDDRGSQGAAGDPGPTGRYQLVDRTGHKAGEMSLAAIAGLIRQGRLFRSDQVAKDSGDVQRLDALPELLEIFDEVMPQGMRAAEGGRHQLPALSGAFDTLGFADLLTQLYQEKRTGRLFVFDSQTEKARVLVFRSGQVISAMSDAEDEWLGKLLLSQGIIDDAAYRPAGSPSPGGDNCPPRSSHRRRFPCRSKRRWGLAGC